MAGLYAPLPMLRSHRRGGLRTDRGRRGLLLLHRSGLSPHTPCRSPGALTHVAACTLARSPIRDPLPEGFSHFVSSMTAPVDSGGSEIAEWAFHPLERCRLSTAHTHSSPSQLRPRRQRLANSARSASRFRDAEPDARVRTIEWPPSIQSGLRPIGCSRQRSSPVAQEPRSLSPPFYHPTARSPLSRSLPQSKGRWRPGRSPLRSGVVLCR